MYLCKDSNANAQSSTIHNGQKWKQPRDSRWEYRFTANGYEKIPLDDKNILRMDCGDFITVQIYLKSFSCVLRIGEFYDI